MTNILVTGCAGCVGHSMVEELSQNPDWHIFAFVKRPENLQLNLKAMANVTVVKADLYQLGDVEAYIKRADAIVHLAAGWSGQAAYDLNVTETLHLFALADMQRCQQVIYFSTASIMDEQNRLLAAAAHGSDYIASKYQMYQRLRETVFYERMTVIFPTAVIGGGPGHPYSHIAKGLQQAKDWIAYLRFVSLDAGFHFIHAEDLAKVTRHLLQKPRQAHLELVLGQPYITLAAALVEIAQAHGYRVPFQLPLPTGFLMVLVKLFKKDMTEWDRFCVDHRHFHYQTTSPADLGVQSRFETLQACVTDLINFG